MNSQGSTALMKFLSSVASKASIGKHVYVVGGAVRNFIISQPIKDVDIVIDSIKAKMDSEKFAKLVQRKIPVKSNLTTNQYGVAIITVNGDWTLHGEDLKGEVIEIANARKESYTGKAGKGYKPTEVAAASIEQDVHRREFTFNTLMWKLADLANGPDKAKIVDITGYGLRDLKAGIVKTPSDPHKTFKDDPTRMLRAVKFMSKYGFKMDPIVGNAIRHNAHMLKNAPHEAIGDLLVNTILKDPSHKKALQQMKELGLLDVVSDMIKTNPKFRSRMERWANNKKVAFLFDLLDVGLPLNAPIGFLDKDQQMHVRKIALGLDDPESFIQNLKQPGRAVDMRLVQKQFTGNKKEMGKFMQKVQSSARQILLDNPKLPVNKITDLVLKDLK